VQNAYSPTNMKLHILLIVENMTNNIVALMNSNTLYNDTFYCF